jgi:Ca-activated chloride channel family protein
MRFTAALGLVAILAVALAGQPDGTPVISIPVLVTDGTTGFVTALDKKNFKVFEDKTEQVITRFSSADAPLSVGIVFDTSLSMGNKLRRSRQAVAEFLKNANPHDEFFLVCFSDRARLVADLTQDTEAIQSRLAFIRAKGRTALLDGVYLATSHMKQAHNARKALLIISDGGDNSGQIAEAEVRNRVRESGAQIYAIRIYEPMPSSAQVPDERSGNHLLRDLCEQTGGKDSDVGNLADLPDIVAKIGLELRNEYMLGYTPKNLLKDGEHRKVQVKLVNTTGSPQLTFRTGYYAPAP